MYVNDQNNPSGTSMHEGFPNPAADTSLRELDLHRLLVPRPASTYLMEVEGSEWSDTGIYSGDLVVIDRALSPNRNMPVVWWHESTFAVSWLADLPKGAVCWGVVTSVIHRYGSRK